MTVKLHPLISNEASYADAVGQPRVSKESSAYRLQQSFIPSAELPSTEGLITIDADGNELYWDGHEWRKLNYGDHQESAHGGHDDDGDDEDKVAQVVDIYSQNVQANQRRKK